MAVPDVLVPGTGLGIEDDKVRAAADLLILRDTAGNQIFYLEKRHLDGLITALVQMRAQLQEQRW